MIRFFHRAKKWQALGVLLLALVVGVRGMVPTGYMLDRSADDGRIVMRLCGGIDDRFVAFKSPASPKDHDAKSTCPFALTATFDVPKDDALIQTAFFGPPLLADVPIVAAPDARAARPPLPPRGPPVRA